MRSHALRPYAAVVRARFRVLLQYRAAAIAGLWTQIFFGLVLVMIYEAFYRSSTAAVQPMTFAQLASYVWLGQALLATLPWNVDGELKELIRSGAVAYELCRPIDLYGLWFARAAAHRTAPAVLRAVPLAAFAMFVLPLLGLGAWRLAPPASLAGGACFVLALGCAILLGCAISTLINITLMWTVAGDGIVMLATTAVSLLSGLIIPLPLVVSIACGVCAFLGVVVLQATSAFWTVDALEVWNAFTHGGVMMSQYPIAIYRWWFRALFTFAIPLACVSYFPGVAILGRADPLGTPAIVGWIAPLAGPGFLIVCLQIWRLGVRRYQSTGS